jgi:hypothetical protein
VISTLAPGAPAAPSARPPASRASWQRVRAVGTAQDRILVREAAAPTARLGELYLVPQQGGEALVVPGLLEEVVGTVLHRLHGEPDRGPRGHHDDGQVRVLAVQLLDERHPLLA